MNKKNNFSFFLDYKKEVREWYAILMEKMKIFLYGNGGNIIMVQVENEYGVYGACDHDYMTFLRDETCKYIYLLLQF